MRSTCGTPIRKERLSRQMFTGLVAILIATMMIAVQYIHSYTMRILSARDEKIAFDQIESAQSQISQIFDNLNSNIDVLMYDNDITTIATGGKKSMDYDYYTRVKAIHTRIAGVAHNYDYIHSIYVYINDSVVISTNVTSSVFPYNSDSIHILHTDFYRNLCALPFRTAISSGYDASDFHAYNDQYTRTGRDESLITLGRASGDTPNGGKRVIMINVNAQKIGMLLASLFDDNCTAYLLNSDQIILCDTDGLHYSQRLPFDLPEETSKTMRFSVAMNGESGQVVLCQLSSGNFSIAKYIPSSSNLKEANTIGTVFLTTFLLCCAVSLILVLMWIRRCLRPIDIICNKMIELENGKLGVQIDLSPCNELGDVIWHFNRMSSALIEMDTENRRAEKALRDQEIRALRAQLNPHFIFNTLNMFKWMAIMHKADDLKECVVALAEILYPAFKENSEVIPLKREINYLEKYILILSHRFVNQVDLDIDLPVPLENALVPRLIMQPIVENCVHHGRYGDGRCLSIRIQAVRDKSDLEVTITDGGQGIPKDKLKAIQSSFNREEISECTQTEHIGLLNVHRRIALQYGRQYGIAIHSRLDKGTIVRIRLPFNT